MNIWLILMLLFLVGIVVFKIAEVIYGFYLMFKPEEKKVKIYKVK